MYCRHLVLRNFRAYSELRLELPAGLCLFVGPNAAGKTSVLEALHVLATTKSPRTTSDGELIRWGETVTRIEGGFVAHDGRPVRLATGLQKGGAGEGLTKRLEVEGQVVETAREVVSRAPVVMFGPDDLVLIKEGPGERRRFLNTALAQLKPAYLDDLLRYRRALRQRNELLKNLRDGSRDYDALGPWTEQLVLSGARLATDRRRFVADLSAHAGPLHAIIGQGESLALSYRGELGEATSEAEAAALLRERLADLADLEVRRGTTLAGPHRDEVGVEVNGVAVRTFGSQGQQRTAALSLKLAQARVSQDWTDEPPLLLLDDCMSELDPQRARAVLDLGLSLDGLLVTSAKLDPVLAERPEAAVFQVRDGQVTQTVN